MTPSRRQFLVSGAAAAGAAALGSMAHAADASAATVLPDLIVQSVTIPPGVTVGQSIHFAATILNQGTVQTPAGIEIGAAFNLDGKEIAWSGTVQALAAGATTVLTSDGGGVGGLGAWVATLGPHTLEVVVNDVHRFPESNTANNTLSATFTVTAPLADLIVQSVAIPAGIVVGQSVHFGATILNQGTASTPAGIEIGAAFNIDGKEIAWSGTDYTALAAGATHYLTSDGGGVAKTGAWIATAGTHTLQVVVNDVHRFAESNLNNNTLSAVFTVAAAIVPPPLAPVNATLPIITGSPTVGGTLTTTNGIWT